MGRVTHVQLGLMHLVSLRLCGCYLPPDRCCRLPGANGESARRRHRAQELFSCGCLQDAGNVQAG